MLLDTELMPSLVRKSSDGFTLIELLITISIIALLAGLSMVSFGGVQKSGRDTRRKSDLKQYANSLASYAGKNKGFYIARPGAGGVPASVTLCGDLGLTTCPTDPKSIAPYIYNYISDGTNGSATATTYALWTGLEDVGSATYWIVCSNGKSGTSASVPVPATICPL